MRLLALGVDHRSAPTSVREALAFDASRRDEALEALKDLSPDSEFVILSTCNRVELYAAATLPAPLPEVPDLTGFLSQFHDVSAELLASHLVAHHDEAVVGHLFRVASSLESLVLGEGQILGQVRDAYQAAATRKSVGPIFHVVFQQAIRVGKKVREVTGMDRGKLSVASVAVDVARDVFDSLATKTVLVIGAGKMSDLTLQHLAALRPRRILICNRNTERAAAAAERWNARAMPFELLDQALIEADVVVSTTAAEEPIVDLDRFQRVQKARRNRLALILDIAVPRDFDPRIGELDQVHLYNVDDLQSQVERNLQGRRKGVDPAQAIIEHETTACLDDLRNRLHAGSMLRQIGAYADSIRSTELDWLYSNCPELNEAQRDAIAHVLLRFQNKLLHHPRAALRSALTAEVPESHSLFSAVRHLFGLGSTPEHARAGIDRTD